MGDNGVRAKPPLVSFNERWEASDTGCWLWTGAVFNHGYGYFSTQHGGKRWVTTASRASYILHKGPIPDGLVVCHRCDNPLCVNPDHLFLGTDRDNIHDAIAKGRFQSPENPCYQRGSQRSRAVMNEEMVRRLRLAVANGTSVTEAARAEGVAPETARHAVKRISWRHVA